MNRKEKLIDALRVAAAAVKYNKTHYNWSSTSSCNCGLVIQALTGKNVNEVDQMSSSLRAQAKRIDDDATTWEEMSHVLCDVTGKPFSEILIGLEKLGMTTRDISHLEYMTNEAILAKAGISSAYRFFHRRYYKNPQKLALYLEAWADILTEEVKAANMANVVGKLETEMQLLLAIADERYEDAEICKRKLETQFA